MCSQISSLADMHMLIISRSHKCFTTPTAINMQSPGDVYPEVAIPIKSTHKPLKPTFVRPEFSSASLTAATWDPGSTSASISARHLYCCGDSITISLLGALPPRPCMVIRLPDLLTRCDPSNYQAAMTPQSVNGKRALLSLRWDPLTIDPSLLPLCLIRRMGPLPPSQLCSCGVCGCFFMYNTECALHKEEGRWNQPLPH